jgi:hypothetical protein
MPGLICHRYLRPIDSISAFRPNRLMEGALDERFVLRLDLQLS